MTTLITLNASVGKRPGRPAQALRAVPTSPGAPVPGPVPPAPAAAPVAAGSAGPSHRAGRPKMDLPVERILRRLREHGSAERACREVGINSRTLTRHMKDDPELRRAVNVAREVGRRATFVHGAPGSSNRCRCDICKFTATTRKQKYVGPRKTGQPCDYCGRVVGRRRNGDVFAHHSEPGVVCPGSQSNNGSIRLAATS